MALSFRPQTTGFALAYAYDPAFDTERESYAQDYERCTETLDFAPLCKSGQSPSLFHFRPLKTSEARKLNGEPQHLWPWLTFRMCLERIDAGPRWKIEREIDGEFPGLGPMLKLSQCEECEYISFELGRAAGELVTQLGMLVFLRSTVPSPKS